MKNIVKGVVLASMMMSCQVLALTLSEARQQGRVGETLSGFIAPIKQDKETLALVKSINEARSENYQKLADSNNISANQVAELAGQKLVERAQPGEYVRGINGQWMKK
ncbi:YdbL family protein [Buttiauxella sp. WJP83]|uniref:YdbL family protein n=1 Tax=Buttiauxella sp. WJP83 TaxID=2986951 RepID=UPI0022DD9AD9|nr:YdbL family protein [Buttiauxella sp. WJP83]WBM68789.1 YdbL family protein [Buttiauxella sp. WJP83]